MDAESSTLGRHHDRSPSYEGEEQRLPGRKRHKRSSQACVYCQRLKMKCSGSVPCERCTRSGKECLLPGRPLRRAWSKKKDIQLQSLQRRLEEMEQRLISPSQGASQQQQQQHSAQPLPTQSQQSPLPPPPAQTAAWFAGSPSAVSPWLAGGPGTEIVGEAELAQLPFVRTGLITPTECTELFDSFMHNCLLHIPLMDPERYTIRYTISTCPFLCAVIVFIAATYSMRRPNLRDEMLDEINDLTGRVFTSGHKSVAVVQAFLLLYFFNQPSSEPGLDQAWMYSGTAIRMATDLNLSSQSAARNGTDGEDGMAMQRDRERTWLFCFLVDRTLSAARGKQWTIRGEDSILGNSDAWCSHSTSRSWDVGISAHADLLKVTSRQTDVLNTAIASGSGSHDTFDCETMMRIMNDELEQWRRLWISRGFFTSPAIDVENARSGGGGDGGSAVSGMTDAMELHTRILYYVTKQASLRYNHAVLVLNCFGLQYCATNPARSEARTYCLTQAIRAAQGIVAAAKDGLSYTVAYSPHTQCTILSFAVVSLIKLASLKREDAVISAKLLGLVESSIAFLESVAIRPTHTPARCASMLRGLVRRSNQHETVSSFRPGMDDHSLPVRSSRAVTPERERGAKMAFTSPPPPPPPQNQQHPQQPPAAHSSHAFSPSMHHPHQAAQPWETHGNLSSSDTLDFLSGADPNLDIFGYQGSIGFAAMTADEILDDSFWLRLPAGSPTQLPIHLG